MDKVEKLEQRIIELNKRVMVIKRTRPSEWMSDTEKELELAANNIKDWVSSAIHKAEQEADAVMMKEGHDYPAPYQELADEYAALDARRQVTDDFKRALANLASNGFDRNDVTTSELLGMWSTDGRDAKYTRMNLIRYKMEAKSRRGSKVERARGVWNHRYMRNIRVAGNDAEKKILAENPTWVTTLEEYENLRTVIRDREDAALRLLNKPIAKALFDLRTAIAESVTGVTDTIYIQDINTEAVNV